jgi:hypothetical protein
VPTLCYSTLCCCTSPWLLLCLNTHMPTTGSLHFLHRRSFYVVLHLCPLIKIQTLLAPPHTQACQQIRPLLFSITALVICCILQSFSHTDLYMSLISNYNSTLVLAIKVQTPFLLAESNSSKEVRNEISTSLDTCLGSQSPDSWCCCLNYIYAYCFARAPSIRPSEHQHQLHSTTALP